MVLARGVLQFFLTRRRGSGSGSRRRVRTYLVRFRAVAITYRARARYTIASYGSVTRRGTLNITGRIVQPTNDLNTTLMRNKIRNQIEYRALVEGDLLTGSDSYVEGADVHLSDIQLSLIHI